MSAALVIVLSLTITSKIVLPSYRAKALGIIYMGVSSALVLGVPFGIVLTNLFSWRTVFLAIACLTVIACVLIYIFLEQIPPEEIKPLQTQIKALANLKVIGDRKSVV